MKSAFIDAGERFALSLTLCCDVCSETLSWHALPWAPRGNAARVDLLEMARTSGWTAVVDDAESEPVVTYTLCNLHGEVSA